MRKVIYVLMLFLCTNLYGQQFVDSVRVYFPVGSGSWSAGFGNNGERMQKFIGRIQQKQSDSAYNIFQVNYFAGASPEGRSVSNTSLSQKRAASITAYLHKYVSFPDSTVTVTSVGEDWPLLRELVELSDLPDNEKEEIISIIAEFPQEEEREKALKQINGGRTWNTLLNSMFPRLRGVNIMLTVDFNPTVTIEEEAADEIYIAEQLPYFKTDTLRVSLMPVTQAQVRRHWYLKTNGLAWMMFVSNLAWETDLGSRWSFAVPLYYSGVNYFKNTLKFRMLGVFPEIRYWFKEGQTGFFAGAHAGVSYYNYAFNGSWRKQSHDKEVPAYGGGLHAGYRMPLGQRQNNRWFLEFSLGAGAYRLYEDIFYNEKNGPLAGSQRRTFVGLDNAAVSIVYRFDKKKREGIK